jgi:hypothetical protein
MILYGALNDINSNMPSSGLKYARIIKRSERIISNKILVISLLLLIGYSIFETGPTAYSQIVPLPPPAQQPVLSNRPNSVPNRPNSVPNQFNNETSLPVIEVGNASLVEGGNVFKVKILDESPITTAWITYVQNGQIVTQNLVKDPQNIYKALIYVHPPAAVIITSAYDVHGKTASVVRYLDVTPLSKSIHEQITSFLFDVGKDIVSLFGSTKK